MSQVNIKILFKLIRDKNPEIIFGKKNFFLLLRFLFFLFLDPAKPTVCTNADITSGMIHAGSFPPCFSYRIETSHRVKVLVTIKSANHVDKIVQDT